MNEELAARYAEELRATLGYEGRMISPSKSRYSTAHPEHVAVFNANVCIAAGKIFWGDLDLTVDEPKLAALAEQIGETVYLLYERDGRFDNEQTPLLDRAVYSVTPTGHSRHQHTSIERTKDGVLQLRPREPDTRPRWRWRVLLHRSRLLHFWKIDRRKQADRHPGDRRSTLLYIGARDNGATPLLVLVCFHAHRLRTFGVEATWYPAHEPPRHAPRPLLTLRPTIKLRRLGLWLAIVAWPGFTWELRAGWQARARWQ